jgi:hypothetical protein
MLFSANSFCFSLLKSVTIPDSKFLSWSDFLDEQPAFLSVEPGREAKPAKGNQPAQEAEAGWVKLESPRWSFITREVEGQYPNWKQCVPTPTSKWTQVILSEEAVAQMLLVIPNLPGADSFNSTIRLRVDSYLTVEGQNKDDQQWTSIPVQAVNVTGNPVSIAINRQYLLTALRFGLNKLEIEDSVTAMVLSNGGKKMVIMPVRMEDAKIQVSPAPAKNTPALTKPANPVPTPEQTPQPNPEEQTKETNTMRNKNNTPEAVNAETHAAESNVTSNGSGSVKSLVDQVEQIKDSLIL